MKRFVAIHNISLGEDLVTPGEIINCPMTQEQQKHLLSRGAIRAMADRGRGPNDVLEDGDEEPVDVPPEIDVMAGVVEKKATARKGGQKRGSQAQTDG